jgi:hypothetical protein
MKGELVTDADIQVGRVVFKADDAGPKVLASSATGPAGSGTSSW